MSFKMGGWLPESATGKIGDAQRSSPRGTDAAAD